ncbi:DEKNAAC100398 [Brettanomyces naardenensis]|uniref:non-specific serine/threonine protein kinase n=1 Tax=Brettanomyces naardenensis TaxID=13370 RepID=A0A448YFQ0_BRENA|nr:DEKNAAC100398 [Brettanomyces naardenensis]
MSIPATRPSASNKANLTIRTHSEQKQPIIKESPRTLHATFKLDQVQQEGAKDNSGGGAGDNDDDDKASVKSVHKSRSTPQLPVPGRNSSLKRSNTTAAHSPKMEYNPYGIFRSSHIVDFGSMFGNGDLKPESQLMLPYPTEDPNKYLPKELQERFQSLEDLYDTTLNSSIGSGGAAMIKKVRLKTNPKVFVALKKFSLFRNESSQQYYRRVVQEYIVMKSFRHVHTITCYELLKLPVYMQRSWGMTMAYLPCDLFSQIKKSAWRATPLSERLCYFKQICFGLKYLHECDVAHLDIKPDNVLVGANGILRITDLGCAEFGHEEPGNFKSSVKFRNKLLGTPPYQPPEVAVYKRLEVTDRDKYDPFKFDYWSLGVLLFVIVTGKTPFAECKPSDLNFLEFEKGELRFAELNPGFLKNDVSKCPTKGRFADGFGNPKIARIAWRLCDTNAKTRLTIPELFDDEFFQKIEMCVDEANYECNFVHHRQARERMFEAEYGSDLELVKNGKITRRLTNGSTARPSFSDKLSNEKRSPEMQPTSPSSAHKYISLVDVGLKSRHREDSKGSNGCGNRSSSVHYQLDLNRVVEAEAEAEREEEEREEREGKKRDEEEEKKEKEEDKVDTTAPDVSSLLLSPRKASSLQNSSSNHFTFNASYSPSLSTAGDSTAWDKYEDAITEDDSSYYSSGTSANNTASESSHGRYSTAETPPKHRDHIKDANDSSGSCVPSMGGNESNELSPGDKYNFIYPDGKTFAYEFDEEDYKNKETEYMVVSYDTMVKSTDFNVVTHAHIIY